MARTFEEWYGIASRSSNSGSTDYAWAAVMACNDDIDQANQVAAIVQVYVNDNISFKPYKLPDVDQAKCSAFRPTQHGAHCDIDTNVRLYSNTDGKGLSPCRTHIGGFAPAS